MAKLGSPEFQTSIQVALGNLREHHLLVESEFATTAEYKDKLRTSLLAIFVELGELANTLDWKPWKTKSVDRENAMDEFADVLAFIGMLLVYMQVCNISTDELAAAYTRKEQKNLLRFQGKSGEIGYGVK